MTLEIIAGGAGTGKTKRCMDILLEAISEGRARHVIFLLYNNQQVQAVRESLRDNLDAYIEPALVTFQGLIREILFKGLSSPPDIVPENVALHLLRKAIEESDLSYYRKAGRSGLLGMLKNTLDELKANGASPEALLEATRQLQGRGWLDGASALKGREVSSIYHHYQELLKEHGHEEWPDAAQRAALLLRDQPGLLTEKKLLLIDGFFYFAPWQKNILAALIEIFPRSVVTLCCSRERREVFRALEDVQTFLTQFPHHKVIYLDENRRMKSPALRHIEKNLFNPSPPPLPADASLSICEAAGQDAEVELIARAIKRMVMEEGYHYSDFGILLRSDSVYKDICRQVFSRFKIPLTIPRRLYLKEALSFRAVIALLQIVTEGWQRGKVITFMRDAGSTNDDSGISPFPCNAVDALENRALALGINDKRGWLEELYPITQSENGGHTHVGPKLPAAIQILAGIEEKLSGPHTARSLVSSLAEVVRELPLLETIFIDLKKNPVSGGSAASDAEGWEVQIEASATIKLYELLDQYLSLAEAAGHEAAEPAALLQFLIGSAETLSLELPGSARGGVSVSNIFESRVPEFRVVFVPGLLEGLFPPPFTEDPIFQDRERRLLNQTGKVLLRERLADVDQERYLFYIAVTRASEKVVLTYPGQDSAGRKRLPSFYLDELSKLFTPQSLNEVTSKKGFGQVLPSPKEIIDEDELIKFVVRGLFDGRAQGRRHGEAEIISLYNLALDRNPERLRETLTARCAAENLSPLTVKTHSLMPRVEPYSISEIYTFGLCKFKYYCKYLLGLKPRQEHRIDYAGEGDIFHETLWRIHRRSALKETPTYPDDCTAFVQGGLEELEAVMQAYYARYLSSSRGSNLKAKMTLDLKRFLQREYEYQMRSPARPAFLELSFGGGTGGRQQDPRSDAEPLRLNSPEGGEILLRGRMDRVDIIKIGNKTFGIILDYKRGAANVTLDKMESGEDIRLPLYMLALERIFQIEPAGCLYYSIREISKRGLYVNEIKEQIGGGEWGLSNRDASPREKLTELLSAVEKMALGRVARIRHGEITVKPFSDSECRYCDYNAVCRYDLGEVRPRQKAED